MTKAEAVALVIGEAGAQGIIQVVRRGEDPGAERMHQLVAALRVLFNELEGEIALKRELAAALFSLGSDLPLTISTWANKGHVWRRGLMENEIYEMLLGVQSIFDDRWFEPQPDETIH